MKRTTLFCLASLISSTAFPNMASWTRNTETSNSSSPLEKKASIEVVKDKESELNNSNSPQKSETIKQDEKNPSFQNSLNNSPVSNLKPTTENSKPIKIDMPVGLTAPINSPYSRSDEINTSEEKRVIAITRVMQKHTSYNLSVEKELAVQMFSLSLAEHGLASPQIATSRWRNNYIKSVGCLNSFQDPNLINLGNKILSDHLKVNPSLGRDVSQLHKLGGSYKATCEV